MKKNATAQSQTNRGRPAGRTNNDYDYGEVQLSRCSACDSTERQPYFKATVQEYSAIGADGKPYTHIVRRWTACAQCGQTRIDRFYENRSLGGSTETDPPETAEK